MRTLRGVESGIRFDPPYLNSANPLNLSQKSAIRAPLKAKTVDPQTYSPPWIVTFDAAYVLEHALEVDEKLEVVCS